MNFDTLLGFCQAMALGYGLVLAGMQLRNAWRLRMTWDMRVIAAVLFLAVALGFCSPLIRLLR